MTIWHGGAPFDIGIPLKFFDVIEYRKGHIWILAGLEPDGSLVYAFRTWRNGATVWSDPKSVSARKFPGALSLRLWESERDGYFQIIVGSERGGDHFWIRPSELEELNPEPS
jgi:hypothetical protein